MDNLYSGWFKIFKDTVVPRLINQPKWFKVEKDLKEKDIVYFQKSESALSSPWTIGEVDQVVVGRDGLIRRAIIKYFNASENDPEHGNYHPQFTDRSVRKLIKLWSVDECNLFDDLAELQESFDSARVHEGNDVVADQGPDLLAGEQVVTSPCDLTPLLVKPVNVEVKKEIGLDEDMNNENVMKLDNLSEIMMSFGISLD